MAQGEFVQYFRSCFFSSPSSTQAFQTSKPEGEEELNLNAEEQKQITT